MKTRLHIFAKRWARPALLSSFAGFALVGCGKEEIKTYSVPKEAAQPSPPPSTNAAPIRWTTPAGWEEIAPTSMRVGNFLVKKGDQKAEVSIIPLPGKIGGSLGSELDNVNRWRGEISLGPITDAELSWKNTSIGSTEGKLYEFSGSQSATSAAVLEQGGTTYFFKMRGDKEVVTEAKPAFAELLKSIRFGGDKEEKKEATVAATEKAPAEDSSTEEGSSEPQWDPPQNWLEKAAPPMVLKSFSISGDQGGKATVAISAFPGDVGGTLANVNRWRGQLGLDSIAENELSKNTTSLDVIGGKATVVDFSGTDAKTGKPARMVAVAFRHGEQTWFYKLMGDDSAVAQEKAPFLKFVQTVRYP